MRQLTYIKKGKLEWWDVPEPKLQSPDDAIVRPIAASRCDGDCAYLHYPLPTILKSGSALHLFEPITKDFAKTPFAIGHECVAEIVSLGENVHGFSVGQKVIVPWSISCGHCENCQKGLTSKCSTMNKDRVLSAYGFGEVLGNFGGMVSDFLRVPFAENTLVATPINIAPSVLAPASDNIPDAWRTVGPMLRKYPRAPVLIVGGGAQSIGLYAAGLAKAMGASQVDYIDTSNTRLDIAQELGANPVKIDKKEKWFKNGQPLRQEKPLITVDASSYISGLNYAIRSLAPGGKCTSVCFYFKKGTPMPLFQMYLNSSTFHIGVSHPRAVLPEVLDLIEQGHFHPEKVTTLHADWGDATEAYLAHTPKVVLSRKSERDM